MNSSRRVTFLSSGRFGSEEWRPFWIQLLLLFVINTLLYVGFPGAREWHRIAEQGQMEVIIRGWDSLAWYVWLAAAPGMLLLIRHYPLTRGRILSNLLRLMVGSLLLYLAVAHLRYALRVLPAVLGSAGPQVLLDFDTYAYNTFAMLPLDFLTYCGFFAVSFSVDYYFQHRKRMEETVQLQLKAAQLQSDLARAELAALRGQLHPHFLFNSFNALATLVRQHKNETAVETIAQLSALLRLVMERKGEQEIPLQQELDFIRRYLEIEHLRFGDKLRVGYDVLPASLDVLVPNIVLQPLVENAIKHGISLRTSPGVLRIRTARAGDRLQIAISDDGSEGPPPDSATRRRPGIGLANIRAQLDKLYGTDYRFEMIKHPGGGTTVRLDLPWREAPVPAMSL